MNTGKIAVDYYAPLPKMVAESLHEPFLGDIILNDYLFPVNGSGIEIWEFNLFEFNEEMSARAFISFATAAGWESGKIEHLLALGPVVAKRQFGDYVIAAPGSCAYITQLEHKVFCPALVGRVDDFIIGFLNFEHPLAIGTKFLAVRKIS